MVHLPKLKRSDAVPEPALLVAQHAQEGDDEQEAEDLEAGHDCSGGW
jgi:hypothetical protein